MRIQSYEDIAKVYLQALLNPRPPSIHEKVKPRRHLSRKCATVNIQGASNRKEALFCLKEAIRRLQNG